jgi:hypothetical protein
MHNFQKIHHLMLVKRTVLCNCRAAVNKGYVKDQASAHLGDPHPAIGGIMNRESSSMACFRLSLHLPAHFGAILKLSALLNAAAAALFHPRYVHVAVVMPIQLCPRCPLVSGRVIFAFAATIFCCPPFSPSVNNKLSSGTEGR